MNTNGIDELKEYNSRNTGKTRKWMKHTAGKKARRDWKTEQRRQYREQQGY